MPIIHATFSTPLLATLAAVLASIVIIATALFLIASAWDQWIHGETQ
jgi:divalent metal cation (Fe/Co/Zn/Cd) transporter